MKTGRAGTMTHDYKRNGTTTLFAALNVLDGTVIGRACSATGTRSSSASSTDRAPGPGRQGDPRRARQLCRPQAPQRPRVAGPPSALDLPLHPDLGSWLNAVEGFFAKLTRRRLKRGVFPFARRPPGGDQPLPRRAQPRAHALRLDRRSRRHHRRRQTWASNVGDNPLARTSAHHPRRGGARRLALPVGARVAGCAGCRGPGATHADPRMRRVTQKCGHPVASQERLSPAATAAARPWSAHDIPLPLLMRAPPGNPAPLVRLPCPPAPARLGRRGHRFPTVPWTRRT